MRDIYIFKKVVSNPDFNTTMRSTEPEPIVEGYNPDEFSRENSYKDFKEYLYGEYPLKYLTDNKTPWLINGLDWALKVLGSESLEHNYKFFGDVDHIDSVVLNNNDPHNRHVLLIINGTFPIEILIPTPKHDTGYIYFYPKIPEIIGTYKSDLETPTSICAYVTRKGTHHVFYRPSNSRAYVYMNLEEARKFVSEHWNAMPNTTFREYTPTVYCEPLYKQQREQGFPTIWGIFHWIFNYVSTQEDEKIKYLIAGKIVSTANNQQRAQSLSVHENIDEEDFKTMKFMIDGTPNAFLMPWYRDNNLHCVYYHEKRLYSVAQNSLIQCINLKEGETATKDFYTDSRVFSFIPWDKDHIVVSYANKDNEEFYSLVELANIPLTKGIASKKDHKAGYLLCRVGDTRVAERMNNKFQVVDIANLITGGEYLKLHPNELHAVDVFQTNTGIFGGIVNPECAILYDGTKSFSIAYTKHLEDYPLPINAKISYKVDFTGK